ncbi:MAG: recombinase family protein [Lachnospiraceae bacterium]|nr:recombinase family protein [Lachnospiraceae bacterium]
MYGACYDALYARQSIEKKDSISVESQLAYCRYETRGAAYIEYTDRGFSGKDTNRPGFEAMMKDIRGGKIKRVIVYKLDRISRSILDFANMMESFQQYQVEFVSSTEKFDTSTPIGRAMLHICIVFAQLERETIQKRVTDAYYARCKRGFFMGGRVPYGYRLIRTVIHDVHTSMYEEVPEESEQLKLIYSLYADTDNSLGDIVRYLNDHQMKQLRGAEWNTARLSEMLRNPVYVKADIDVYRFFQNQGTQIANPASDFTGQNACYLYQGIGSGGGKRSDLSGKELVLAPHSGFIPSKLWLACRERCLNNRQSAKTCKPKNSWLSGKLKCGNCGYALTVRRAKTKWGRYFVCSRSGEHGSCKGAGCTVYADALEDYMMKAVGKRLSEITALEEGDAAKSRTKEEPALYGTAGNMSDRLIQKRIRLTQIEEEIHGLLSKVPEADSILMKYINERVLILDAERNALQEEIVMTDNADTGAAEKRERLSGHIKAWETFSFSDRQKVADLLIKVIRIADGNMEITWKL